jgi:opacity protein-like surface antigen
MVFVALLGSGALAQESNTIPAGTILQIRLKSSVSSYTSKAGTPVWAEVIAPVEVRGRTILPMGTELLGYVKGARKVGLGFARETALLHLEFPRIQLPKQAAQELHGQVARVDDAREQVDAEGRIQGIRATASFSSMLSGFAVMATSFDPVALMFGLSASLSVFRLPDSSVVLPAGAELQFRLTQDLVVSGEAQAQYPAFAATEEGRAELERIVRALPFRTETESDGTPSDLTSLVYLGSLQAIERAFDAAGWVRSDKLNEKSTYGVMRSIIENQGYRAAPMSTLTLNKKTPELTYAKTLNTFFSRHHLRVYSQADRYEGSSVWTSTATYDTGIGFSRAAKTFVHVINENIDEERGKVVNDLTMTGCVEGVTYVDRPWIPRDAQNATGDTLRTDGRIAVLRLNDCLKPRRADGEDASKDLARLRESAYVRPVRNAILTLRNDLLRGNALYQAYHGGKMAGGLFRKAPEKAGSGPRTFRVGGQEFFVVEGAKARKQPGLPREGGTISGTPAKPRTRDFSNRLGFSLSAGLNEIPGGDLSSQGFVLTATSPAGASTRDALRFQSTLERGWAISPKVTLHSWKYVSNEFAYTRVTTNYRLYGGDEARGTSLDSRSKAAIRAFTYNAIFHATPNGKRIRPYVAVGPSFQLIHLLDARPVENAVIKLVERDVALLIGAYDFGSKPPLEGGGMFQFGLNYGGGARVHLTPRIFLRADFRETLSRQPDFWKGSREALSREIGADPLRLEATDFNRHGKFQHRQVTLGVGFAF